jgi:hypothetical protein
MNEELIQSMVDQRFNQLLGERLKASGTSIGVAPTGTHALFNQYGVDPGIASTIVKPDGIEDFLEGAGHIRKSMYLNPMYAIMTGQTASSGTEPTAPCDENVPTAGDLALCHQTWTFGEMTMKSKPVRLDNLGELVNRSSPIDMKLLNNPFATPSQTEAVTTINVNAQQVFRSALVKAMVELAFDFKRRYARLIWTGNPTNTAASSGGYLEYNGLQKIVNTGYKDSITGVSCSAADSLVNGNIVGTIAQNSPSTVVRNFVETYRDRRLLADMVGVRDVQYAWVMRRQLFLALTEIWPCAYYTYRCYNVSPSGGASTAFIDATTQAKMRDDMRAGLYLLIDAEKVPVIIDNTMEELNVGGGNFQSDAYLMPLKSSTFSETDGQITYLEYFDYGGPFGMQSILGELGPQDEYRVSSDGRYAIFFLGGTAFCKQIMMRTRKRLICRAPFLAARIDDIRYAVYQHEREWQPGTSFYEQGGATSFNTPNYISPV